LRREFLEETGLSVAVERLLYISESYDRATGAHFLNATFAVAARGEPHVSGADAHVVDSAWVRIEDLAERLSVRVVREPLVAALAGDSRRYYGFADAGITVEFSEPS